MFSVADFSRTPGGRYRAEGEFSGEEYRKDYLEPALLEGHSIQVDLDGPIGFSTSFLDEVFGGLIRKFGPAVQERIIVVARRRTVRAEQAHHYMERAIAYGKFEGAKLP